VKNRIVGNVRVIGEVAVGGTARIWLCEDLSGRGRRALKVLKPNVERGTVKALRKEYALLKKLSHPGLLTVYGFGRSDGSPYMLMEYFLGESLRKTLSDRKLAFPRIAEILGALSDVLGYLHSRRIVHSDIKPENVLVSEDRLKLLDLSLARHGLARYFAARRSGTPSYMSPEQVQEKRLTPASDIYSFAALAYELFAGRPPFIAQSRQELLQAHLSRRPDPPSRFNRLLAPELDKLVLSGLAKDRSLRPKDVRLYGRQLAEWAERREG
jgi:serine/threonine protein kinase